MPRSEQSPAYQDESMELRQEAFREVGTRGVTEAAPRPRFAVPTTRRSIAEQLGINLNRNGNEPDWGEVEVALSDAISDELVSDELVENYFGGSEPDVDDEPFREPVRASDFPAYDIPRWESASERENAANTWFRQMEYRLRWIFYRDEREGVNRMRFTSAFNPDDFKKRAEKAGKPHFLNTETSQFYDWNIGGTDFIIRLESFQIKETPVLRCHFIHKPSGLELSYEDRIWDGQNYRECNQVWANT